MKAKYAKRFSKTAALTAALVLAAIASAGAATETPSCASQSGAAKSRVSFSECRVETTPPYEEGSFFECGSGEVIVAVYSNSVRCCSLTVG